VSHHLKLKTHSFISLFYLHSLLISTFCPFFIFPLTFFFPSFIISLYFTVFTSVRTQPSQHNWLLQGSMYSTKQGISMVTRVLCAFGPNPPEDPKGLPTFAPCYLELTPCFPYHAGLFLSVQTIHVVKWDRSYFLWLPPRHVIQFMYRVNNQTTNYRDGTT